MGTELDLCDACGVFVRDPKAMQIDTDTIDAGWWQLCNECYQEMQGLEKELDSKLGPDTSPYQKWQEELDKSKKNKTVQKPKPRASG